MDPILDQSLEANPGPARHWKVTVLWAFLTYTICNIILGYFSRLLMPFFTNMAENETATAGQVIELYDTILSICGYAISLVIGIWMGKSLGLHSKLQLWKVFLLCLLIEAGSAVLQAFSADISWWVEHPEKLWQGVLLRVVYKGSMFAFIGSVACMLTRKRSVKNWLLALGLFIFLEALQFLFVIFFKR